MVYKIQFTTGYEPDLKDVNEEAENGWELVQMGQSTEPNTEKQWWYLLKHADPIPPAP